MTVSKRGGKRPNAGAPKKENPAKPRSIRLNDQHWDKFNSIGGVEWLRYYLEHIDKK
jgi:hypothetical protein